MFHVKRNSLRHAIPLSYGSYAQGKAIVPQSAWDMLSALSPFYVAHVARVILLVPVQQEGGPVTKQMTSLAIFTAMQYC